MMKPSRTDGASRGNAYAELVRRIQDGDPEAEAELYHIFSTGVRFLVMRRLRNSSVVDDELHSTFIITIEAIRNGMLREPERLMGFVRTIVSRRIAEHIQQEMFRRNRTVDAAEYLIRDRRAPADQIVMERQQGEIARKVLQEMSANDREVLVRFYLEEQPPERICREMHLTETQYRLLKNRAKTRFGERGHRKITSRPEWSQPPVSELSKQSAQDAAPRAAFGMRSSSLCGGAGTARLCA